jgi:hypothetical protein
MGDNHAPDLLGVEATVKGSQGRILIANVRGIRPIGCVETVPFLPVVDVGVDLGVRQGQERNGM